MSLIVTVLEVELKLQLQNLWLRKKKFIYFAKKSKIYQKLEKNNMKFIL